MKGHKCWLVSFALIFFPSLGFAATHSSKNVSVLYPPDNRACFFFTLDGVSIADPASGNSWFAIPMTANGYKEIVSLLMLAKVASLKLNVTTTGNLICGGLAEVGSVATDP